MAKSNRTCFGRGMCLHIGLCCDFWADDGLCVCDPVDAAEYPQAQRLYIAGNVSGFANPNIRTIFPDGHDYVHTFDRGDYCWASWGWGSGTFGTVKFELRDGNTVRASRSTLIVMPPLPEPPAILGILEVSYPKSAIAGSRVDIRVKVGTSDDRAKWYTAAQEKPLCARDCSTHGYYALPTVLIIKGDVIGNLNAVPIANLLCKAPRYTAVNKMSPAFETSRYKGAESRLITCSFTMPDEPLSGMCVLTSKRDEGGHGFPYHYMDKRAFSIVVKPCNEGEKRNPETCWDGSVIHTDVCKNNTWTPSGDTCPPEPASGEKRSPKTCWDGSVIHTEKYDATLHRWVPSGETCPPEPAAGAKRSPTTCWDGSVIHAEMFDATLKRWVPTGETPPPKPECTEGDKKAGYVCVAGKWQAAPAVPEPVVEPIPECKDPWTVSNALQNAIGEVKAGLISDEEATEKIKAVYRGEIVCDAVPEPVPPADGMFTIEFQELIAGITPPRVPLLIPGLETLPLLPGWIVRDAAGNIVNKGAELPTLHELNEEI